MTGVLRTDSVAREYTEFTSLPDMNESRLTESAADEKYRFDSGHHRIPGMGPNGG